jgi:hypothetical protein
VGASFVVLLSLSAQSCFAKSISTRSSWQGGIFEDLRALENASIPSAIRTATKAAATKHPERIKSFDLAILAMQPND